jgi:Uma2 family endonuclease
MAAKTIFTIEDFERLPSEVAKNHELVDGELVDVSGNTLGHNLLRGRTESLLLQWANDNQSGTVVAEQEYDFLGNAHAPDVSFFGEEKRSLCDVHKRVQRFVPDLAIEVASESDTYFALLKKKDRYLRAGTAEVWLISTATQEIMIYDAERGRAFRAGDTLTSDLLRGFSIALIDLFEGLPPDNG